MHSRPRGMREFRPPNRRNTKWLRGFIAAWEMSTALEGNPPSALRPAAAKGSFTSFARAGNRARIFELGLARASSSTSATRPDYYPFLEGAGALGRTSNQAAATRFRCRSMYHRYTDAIPSDRAIDGDQPSPVSFPLFRSFLGVPSGFEGSRKICPSNPTVSAISRARS
jgi:hypothetical protein